MDTPAPNRTHEASTAIQAHLEAAISFAREGLAEAERMGYGAVQQPLLRCLTHLARAQAVASAGADMPAEPQLGSPSHGEEVSSATFAAGDGANDAQVVPDEARGKPGNWPGF